MRTPTLLPLAVVVAALSLSGSAAAQSAAPSAEQAVIAASGVKFTGSLTPPAGTTPIPTAADGPDPLGGSTLFDGDVISHWTSQSAAADRVSYQPNPLGDVGNVLRFDAFNTDVAPLTPTANPRAQLVTPPGIVTAGTPFWESYGVYFPQAFPLASTYAGGWVSLGSPFYGRPYNGLPSTSLVIMKGQLEWRTNGNATPANAILWQTPVIRGQWLRVTWYVDPSADGFVELYINDQPVSVTYAGVTTQGLHLPVIDASDYQGPWWMSQLSAYYSLGLADEVTLFYRHFTIATTQLRSDRVVQ